MALQHVTWNPSNPSKFPMSLSSATRNVHRTRQKKKRDKKSLTKCHAGDRVAVPTLGRLPADRNDSDMDQAEQKSPSDESELSSAVPFETRLALWLHGSSAG